MYRTRRFVLFLIGFGIVCMLLSANTAMADYDQTLDNAMTAEQNQQDRVDNAYRHLDHAGDLLRDIENKYKANQKDIAKGKTITLAGALGVTKLPGAMMTAIRALGLTSSITESTGVLSAYETAINRKKELIPLMKILNAMIGLRY